MSRCAARAASGRAGVRSVADASVCASDEGVARDAQPSATSDTARSEARSLVTSE
jgi:hypothetical protein